MGWAVSKRELEPFDDLNSIRNRLRNVELLLSGIQQTSVTDTLTNSSPSEGSGSPSGSVAPGTSLTGWGISLDETDVTIAMNDGTRTFTITRVVGSLQYFIQGESYSLPASDTVVIDDTEGLWFIYYVGTTLTASQTPWDIAVADKAMVALVYWDATNNATITLGWEFHTWVMDPATHEENHYTFGTRFREGLAVSDNGDDTVDVTTGIVYDEDIKVDITDGIGGTLFEQDLSPAKLPLLYRDGANGDWRKFAAATTVPVIVSANVLQLNELNGVWALTNVTNNKFICYWILATTDIAEPIISIPGQVEATTAQAVRDANPISSMSFGSLPVAEYKIIARMIVKGTVGGNFFDISEIDDFRDVSTEPGTGTTITDHSSLTGVTANQHHKGTIIRGSQPANKTIFTAVDAWENWGSALDLGSQSGAVHVSAQIIGSCLYGDNISRAGKVRIGISLDNGNSYTYGSEVWGQNDDTGASSDRRKTVGAAFYRTGTATSNILIQVQAWIDTGATTDIDFVTADLTAQLGFV